MRALGVGIVVALTLLSAVPTMAASTDSLATTSVYVRDVGTLLTWTPAPGATGYHVYRAVDHDRPELIGTTVGPLLFDAHDVKGTRVVYSILPFSAIPGITYSQSDCVTWRNGSASVTVSECAGSRN